MSIKATRALFPYVVKIDVYNADGAVYSDTIKCFDDDEELPMMSEETMTATEWVEQYGADYLPDFIDEGDTAELEICFYEDFDSRSWDDAFYTSMCAVDSSLNVTYSNDDDTEQETKADDEPVLVCFVKRWGKDDYEIDFDDSIDSDALFKALEAKHASCGSSVRGSLRDILHELSDYDADKK